MSENHLADNIAYFARALRKAGLPVGPGTVLDALAAVEAAGIGGRDDFYWILHSVFVTRHEHSALFEQAFHIFFRRRGLLDKMIAAMSPIAPLSRRSSENRKPARCASTKRSSRRSSASRGESRRRRFRPSFWPPRRNFCRRRISPR